MSKKQSVTDQLTGLYSTDILGSLQRRVHVTKENLHINRLYGQTDGSLSARF